MRRFPNYPPCARDLYDPVTMMPPTNNNIGGVPMYPLPVISPSGFPTGMPLGPAMNPPPMPQLPSTAMPPAAQTMLPSAPGEVGIPPTTLSNPNYTAGYLRTQIGKKMRVEFLVGSNSMTDRTGVLVGVGASYILLHITDENLVMLCDLYSIKFVSIFQ